MVCPRRKQKFHGVSERQCSDQISDVPASKQQHRLYKNNETADADEVVEFERDNVRGRSFGATVKIGEKVIELLKDVEIEAFESPELVRSNVRYAKINTGSATIDQINNKIDLRERDSVSISIASKPGSGKTQTTDVRADRASVAIDRGAGKSSQLNKFELFDNVHIVSAETGAPATNIDCGYAMYDKVADRFELKNDPRIVTTANDKLTEISASQIVYEQSAGKIVLTGNAEIKQGTDQLKGDLLYADLFPDKKIRDAIVRETNASLNRHQDRSTTITAPELNASFNDRSASGDAKDDFSQENIEIIPNQSREYSSVSIAAIKGVTLTL